MKFRLNVNMTEQDYLDYNVFVMTRSSFGKKSMNRTKYVFIMLFITIIIFLLFVGKFSTWAFVSSLPFAISTIYVLVFYKKIMIRSIKKVIKNYKKDNKLPVDLNSVLEFYDDYFVETTTNMKEEVKYSAIERISVVDNKVIYIHKNNTNAYILSLSCFESKKQQDTFFEFINTKCANINIY